MNRFSTYLLCLLLLVSSFPSNAYTCVEQMQHDKAMDSNHLDVSEPSFGAMSHCHDESLQTANNDEQPNNSEQNCCDDCASCLHLTVYITLSESVLSEIKMKQTQIFYDNFASITLGIITPPPIA